MSADPSPGTPAGAAADLAPPGAGPAGRPALVVDRLSVVLRPEAEGPGADAGRLRGAVRHALGGGLEMALRELDLPPGRWCLPRLDLTVPLDLARTDPALARAWSRAVAAAIEVSVREGRPDTPVHYRHDGEVLADAVAGLAAGRVDRLWAWRQTGILRAADPDPLASPGAAILAALDRHPRQTPAALVRAAERCGLAALDRALGGSGWQRLAARLAPDTGWTAVAAAVRAEPAGGPDRSARALAATLAAGSPLAALIRASRLRPTAPVRAAWAVLVVADTAPALLGRPPRGGLPGLLAERLTAHEGAPPERGGTALAPPAPGVRPAPEPAAPPATHPVPPSAPSSARLSVRPGDGVWRAADPRPGGSAPGGPPASPPASPPRADGSRARGTVPPGSRTAAPPRPPGPVDGPGAEPGPGSAPGVDTGWTGLLFLFATATEAGLPGRVLDEPALAARPLSWVLHRVGRLLLPGLPADDAAPLALAGLGRARAATVLDAAPATPAEQARTAELAADWARVTAVRLHGERAGADPAEAVAAMARRAGRIIAEPGWIEATLSAADTDLAVRRAGLDLDPGWLGWLGAVVRYRYV
ncbi:hypothetical protein OHS33_32885 [Streptomyces sp. NBC_00536]|uniref:hypothetical protein n=1 Tax=Streptomyces sp. NBC_00536 TaxID=2975769 RepID=UPI002E8006E5|nr:hypothetical protein [Streptomyces sp. NBC_00536]WUC82740.1 hypothetical protein OHS33_32885 [Streptomyces sp. NBC_00536]